MPTGSPPASRCDVQAVSASAFEEFVALWALWQVTQSGMSTAPRQSGEWFQEWSRTSKQRSGRCSARAFSGKVETGFPQKMRPRKGAPAPWSSREVRHHLLAERTDRFHHQLILVMQMGTVPHELVMESIRTFGEQVMPHFA